MPGDALEGSVEGAQIAVDTDIQDKRRCGWCGDTLPLSARSDAKYCGDQCRSRAALHRGRTGRVRSVTAIKGGRVSVVVYMDETNLKAGQEVCIGPVRD